MNARAVFPKCATCKLKHASDADPVELGWYTFATKTAHLAYCVPRFRGRIIRSQCSLALQGGRDVDRDGHGYTVARRTCRRCGKHVEKKNREAGQRVRAGVGT